MVKLNPAPTWCGLWWVDSIWSQLAARDTWDAEVACEVRQLVELLRSHPHALDETVEVLLGLQRAVDRVLREVIAQARTGPHLYSWAEIGEALGVGRTAAQKRFGEGLTRRHIEALRDELYEAIKSIRAELDRAWADDVPELQRKLDVLTRRYGTVSPGQLELELGL
ncbi:hypothetical protein ACFWIY_20210 [Streptomyces sioyaensis]|uniref:hypothetical protein n=1 Tax=Streptomyces sioyaensis TaxID=67364 RepID=UPI0036538078